VPVTGRPATSDQLDCRDHKGDRSLSARGQTAIVPASLGELYNIDALKSEGGDSPLAIKARRLGIPRSTLHRVLLAHELVDSWSTRRPALVGETSRRAAFFLASLSVAVCVLGSMRAIATVQANLTRYNRPDAAALAWIAVPLALAITGMIATLRRSIGPIWLCTGALFGFVVVGAWSLGLFYVTGH